MIDTRRFLGYLRIGRKIKGCCGDALAGQDIKQSLEGGRENDTPGMDVESRSLVAVNSTGAMARFEWFKPGVESR